MIYALMLATSALSGDSPAAVTQEATQRSERRVCRTFERPASRMGSERICKTASEWERERQDAERFTTDRQNRNLEVPVSNAPPAPQ